MDNTISKIRKSNKIKLLLTLSTVILITLMFPKGESIESEVTEGSIWIHNDLIAPFSFPIIKDPDTYKKEIQSAVNTVYPVYIKNKDVSPSDSLAKYNKFLLPLLDELIKKDTLFNPTFLSDNSVAVFKSLRLQEYNLSVKRTVNLKQLFSNLKNSLLQLERKGILSLQNDLKKDSIAIRVGNIDRIEPKSNYFSIDEVRRILNTKLLELNLPEKIYNAALEYVYHFVFPNIIYNKTFTLEEIEQAKNSVSKYSGIVNENERIIAKHERVTHTIKLKIDSYRIAKGETTGMVEIVLQQLGKFIHIGFLITLMGIYLFILRKKIYYDNKKIFILAINILSLSFITYLINQLTVDVPLHYLIFVPVSAMMVTIIFDSRVGFHTLVVISLITGALRGNDYAFVAANLFAGALAIFTVRDIKNRSQIFRSFIFILIGYIVTIIAFGLERFATTESILMEMAFASTNALISPVFTYGLLIFFERFFDITTDLTLVELSSFDMPLLKELAKKAPGSFNHSLTMGTLAEAGAEAIGANPLLARVGAYYHDVGKLLTPQNFVENQTNNKNIHANLSPEESVLLISQHVKEGIQIAKKYKLPQEIIDFIPMHHGTMIMSFFFDKAKKLYGPEKVDVNKYKYPGPKPNTKETAIVMIADGCESAVRAISDPNSENIENVVDQIINTRIEQSQFDDAPITYSDINKIKTVFTNILIGQYHKRIRYPDQDKVETGNGIEKENE